MNTYSGKNAVLPSVFHHGLHSSRGTPARICRPVQLLMAICISFTFADGAIEFGGYQKSALLSVTFASAEFAPFSSVTK
jgi:hypothetical protein